MKKTLLFILIVSFWLAPVFQGSWVQEISCKPDPSGNTGPVHGPIRFSADGLVVADICLPPKGGKLTPPRLA